MLEATFEKVCSTSFEAVFAIDSSVGNLPQNDAAPKLSVRTTRYDPPGVTSSTERSIFTTVQDGTTVVLPTFVVHTLTTELLPTITEINVVTAPAVTMTEVVTTTSLSPSSASQTG